VRWPDVAQAISAARPDWLDDPGLFDLPYDPSAVTLSFPQAASVAAGWGRLLGADIAEGVPSYIRRMPANWSDLSRSERSTWGIEFVGRGPARMRRVSRLRPLKVKVGGSSAAAPANGQVAELVRPEGAPRAAVDGPSPNGRDQLGNVEKELASAAVERRHHVRVPLDGRVHIRCDHTTISAGLVDLSQRGVRCVLPEAPPLVSPDATLGGPFLVELESYASRICLDVPGRISWRRGTGPAMHFGVAFDQLVDFETEGLRRFLAAANRKRNRR
jgi:hypothetical protein